MSTSSPITRAAGTVAIRPATPADAPALRAIAGLSASTRRLLDHDLGLADRRCLLATDGSDRDRDHDPDGQSVVGYAAAILQDTDAHVIDIAVDPGLRRRGIGRLLLDALIDAVHEAGAEAVTLEVRASNLGSQALYRRRGFVDEGRRPRYYPDGEDAQIWWLRPDTAALAPDDVEEVD